MNRIIEKALGHRLFSFNEDAATLMESYLVAFRNNLGEDATVSEIMEDIELRIGELFEQQINRLHQVVSLRLVEEVIEQLGLPDGSIFSCDRGGGSRSTDDPESTTASRPIDPGPRRFARVVNRKKIGGVCAGIAHYFGWDATLVRVACVAAVLLLFFSPSYVFVPNIAGPLSSIGGVALILYVIFWIVLPTIRIDDQIFPYDDGRRLFRSRDDRRFCGVCSGLAYYFNVESWVIRLIMALLIFASGVSLGVYVALWILVPYAVTPAEKCQMHGLPLTVENLLKYANRK